MLNTIQRLARNWFDVSPREFRMILAASIFFMAGALAYVWPHIKMVKIAYGYQNEKRAHHNLLQENRLLMLEKSSLQSLGRVLSIAEQQLGMRQPAEKQVVTVFLK
ncbi:MAG: cell division protein FtsL [Nitrospinales bacterium]